MKQIIVIILCLAVFPAVTKAQEWEVPEEQQSRLAPFAFSDSSVAAGETIFYANCKLCHGDPGKRNYQQLNPLPGDPAETIIQSNSDGSLRFKISEGKGLMPSFKNVLTQDEIWNVIAYIRSFNSSYIQAVAEVSQLKDLKWSVIKILLSFNHDSKMVTATLTGLEGEKWTPVPDAEVLLTAKRYFGHLTIDEPRMTNSDGVVSFEIPSDLPSDRDGGMTITAELADRDLFGSIMKDTTIMTGSENKAPSLTSERAMWNVGRKAPVWLLIAYPGGVLAVWGLIFYVLFQLRTVYIEGNDEEEL